MPANSRWDLIRRLRVNLRYLLHVSNPRVHLQEDDCTYRNGILCIYIHQVKQSCRYLRVEDIINENINLQKVHFVGLYCIIILQCTVLET